jgi:hypothetical protein
MMAKKVSAQAGKKAAKSKHAASRPKRVATAASGKAAAKEKYRQTGAPWWKQFLPG